MMTYITTVTGGSMLFLCSSVGVLQCSDKAQTSNADRHCCVMQPLQRHKAKRCRACHITSHRLPLVNQKLPVSLPTSLSRPSLHHVLYMGHAQVRHNTSV